MACTNQNNQKHTKPHYKSTLHIHRSFRTKAVLETLIIYSDNAILEEKR